MRRGLCRAPLPDHPVWPGRQGLQDHRGRPWGGPDRQELADRREQRDRGRDGRGRRPAGAADQAGGWGRSLVNLLGL
jgi:hypothetical protein